MEKGPLPFGPNKMGVKFTPYKKRRALCIEEVFLRD